MGKIELKMPKMGESIMEATILKWVKSPGDTIAEDETILEIATDKVDSDIPSPVDGVLGEILFKENDVVEVGKVIAYILTEADASAGDTPSETTPEVQAETPAPASMSTSNGHQNVNGAMNGNGAVTQEVPYVPQPQEAPAQRFGAKTRFYSPLVRNIAAQEKINIDELETITGTGKDGRVTKKDILQYLEVRPTARTGGVSQSKDPQVPKTAGSTQVDSKPSPVANMGGADIEIIEMDRMRKLIAEHMVRSKHTSPHVTSFVEADVTNLVNWRNKVKGEFQAKYGEKITFTPIFIEAVTKSINDFPMINISLDGDKIIKKKDVNIGMAAALPSGNLIVPVIKKANFLNLVGLAKSVNDLATRARAGKLKPEEIQGGTFTVTNVGTFGNVMGTPIINQPQVAILATGAIRKKPAVVETEYGDVIAIRQMMYLSLSYDHRIVDGFLGGSFLRRVADYLEAFNVDEKI